MLKDETKMNELPTSPPLSSAQMVETAMTAHRTLSRALHALGAPEWQTLDLTMPQMKVLLFLDMDGALTIGELACRLNFAKPAMSILVEKLVQGGYLRRTEDAEDRRRTIVQLSDKGSEIVATLLRGTRATFSHYLNRMDARDLAALVQGLTALADLIGADTVARLRDATKTVRAAKVAHANAKPINRTR
jgi:DNA-binding MarR family transcriptional regulator